MADEVSKLRSEKVTLMEDNTSLKAQVVALQLELKKEAMCLDPMSELRMLLPIATPRTGSRSRCTLSARV